MGRSCIWKLVFRKQPATDNQAEGEQTGHTRGQSMRENSGANSFNRHLFVEGMVHWVVPGFKRLWEKVLFCEGNGARDLNRVFAK